VPSLKTRSARKSSWGEAQNHSGLEHGTCCSGAANRSSSLSSAHKSSHSAARCSQYDPAHESAAVHLRAAGAGAASGAAMNCAKLVAVLTTRFQRSCCHRSQQLTYPNRPILPVQSCQVAPAPACHLCSSHQLLAAAHGTGGCPLSSAGYLVRCQYWLSVTSGTCVSRGRAHGTSHI
jgi:hypothetical protein